MACPPGAVDHASLVTLWTASFARVQKFLQRPCHLPEGKVETGHSPNKASPRGDKGLVPGVGWTATPGVQVWVRPSSGSLLTLAMRASLTLRGHLAPRHLCNIGRFASLSWSA